MVKVNTSGYYLGIDVGTSSLKATVIDGTGKTLSSCGCAYSNYTDCLGMSQQDPEVWYSALVRALALMRTEQNVDMARIDGVCSTGQMRGATFVDGSLNPVRKSILWNDTLCRSQVAQIIRRSDYSVLRDINCNKINTMCTLPKLMWVRENEPDVLRMTRYVMYPKDYINMKLTGVVATEHTDVSGSFMYDMRGGCWSESVLREFSISGDILPDICRSFDIVGTVTAGASAQTGIPAGVPVLAGGSDATVEFYAMGESNSDKCKIRLGSSSSICTLKSWDTAAQTATEHYCWKYVEDGKAELDINTSACALSVKWLRDVFYSELGDAPSAYGQIDLDATQIPPGADGLLYHPYINGENAPFWNPSLSGSFSGMRMSHSRKHFARAVYEGVSFSLYHVLTLFPEIYSGCSGYVLLGGGTKAREWTQTLVNVLGKPAAVDTTADASFGAALMALKNAGGAIEGVRHDMKLIDCDRDCHDRYRERFEQYRKEAEYWHLQSEG